MLIKQSESTPARRTIMIGPLADATTDAAYTSALGTGDLQISKNGGAFANAAGSATHREDGYYQYEFTAAECDTLGSLVVKCNASAAYPDAWQVQVVAFDPYAAAGLGLTNLNATVSSRSSHSVTDIYDTADAVETGLTVRGALRLLAAVLAGESGGAGTSTETFSAAGDPTKVRITTTFVGGNRDSVTTDTTDA